MTLLIIISYVKLDGDKCKGRERVSKFYIE